MKARLDPLNRMRWNRLIHERVHDPYKTKYKLPEPTVCPVCQAMFKDGRWQRVESRPIDANEAICQACHRTKDSYPAGLIALDGAFAQAHKAEILHLARRMEKEENAEHPLHRIMQIEEDGESILLKTTDIHLPRSIGQALRHAYKGRLQLHYDPEGYFISVNWHRE
jgi:hypothetical protein